MADTAVIPKYEVYEINYGERGISLFIKTDAQGCGRELLFHGSALEPKFTSQRVTTSPFSQHDFAGSKKVGLIDAADVEMAWKRCDEFVEIPAPGEVDLSSRCSACSQMLLDEKLVKGVEWWSQTAH